MALEDREKITFTSQWGIYCNRVMPFELKNARAIYERAATTILHNMIHKEAEVYVDDIILKSKERSGHLVALTKFFERLKKYRMRLNPPKCTFGVTSRKLFHFIITQRRIEIDPTKIKAIMDMAPPK